MNIPTLPPFFLDSCLALSKHLYAMKSGSARLEASPSHFLFSVDHPPGNKETGLSGSYGPFEIRKTKKKSPSDFKRDARRREEHLARKRSSCQPAASSPSNPTQPTDPPSSADLSVISETPMIVENSDVMETESSEDLPLIELETPEVLVTCVEEAIPVISTTRKNSEPNEVLVNESRNLTKTNNDDSTIKQDLPPDQPENAWLHEVHIMICAPSKAAAKKRSHQFPRSKMISAHPSNKKNHFMFSTNVNDEYITKLKSNINKFEDLLHFNVKSSNEDFHPDHDHLHHCQQCKSSGIYDKWLAEQNFSD